MPTDLPRRFYERTRGDEFYDEVRITTVPRYKTSGLSGDEWRTSVHLEILRKGRLVHERDYNRLEWAATHLPWLLTTLAETVGIDPRMTDDLCMQPGCDQPWTTVYRKLGDGCGNCGHVKAKDADDLFPHYRAFCARHARRGDCGLDDADRNYEVVEGPGPAGPGKRSADESPSAFGGMITLKEPPRAD